MPKKNGFEVIKEIKSNKELCKIPIIIFTTSKQEEDILRCYELGANSFITKPVTFKAIIEVMETIAKYWFEVVELPL